MNAHRDEEAASPLIAAPGGRSHAADAHVLSAAFLFVFSAYSAAQNLQTSVNTVRAPLLPFRSQLRIPDPSPVQYSTASSFSSVIHASARRAGGRPGHRLDGDCVHLLHALLRGLVARGHAYRPQARARRRHQRIRALHPRQPRPVMVRASWSCITILSGRHGSCTTVWGRGVLVLNWTHGTSSIKIPLIKCRHQTAYIWATDVHAT